MADERIGLADLVTFPLRLTNEILRAPHTLRALRELTDDLAATSQMVRATVDEVASTIEPLTGAVDRVANIDKAVAELHSVFFAFLDRVPGSKRLRVPVPDDADIEDVEDTEDTEDVDDV